MNRLVWWAGGIRSPSWLPCRSRCWYPGRKAKSAPSKPFGEARFPLPRRPIRPGWARHWWGLIWAPREQKRPAPRERYPERLRIAATSAVDAPILPGRGDSRDSRRSRQCAPMWVGIGFVDVPRGFGLDVASRSRVVGNPGAWVFFRLRDLVPGDDVLVFCERFVVRVPSDRSLVICERGAAGSPVRSERTCDARARDLRGAVLRGNGAVRGQYRRVSAAPRG